MATFADFALLRAVSSYGGAEVLRARRILPGGVAAPVHLALLGTDKAVVRRVAAVAGVQAPHDQVARIIEVGTYDGQAYAVADAVDGVELSAVLEHDRRKKATPDLALSLAVAGQLAQLSVELNERGDVWAADGGTGLSALFPAGLRLDGVVLRADGKVAVRVLAGAVQDPARPSPFRAPELRNRKPSASSDVFLVTQVLRAMLSGDASATSAPRLTGPAASLANLLAAGLSASPDERLGLFMLVERFVQALASAAPRLKPAQVVAAALKRDYKVLAPEIAAADPDYAATATGLRGRLGAVRRALDVAWPVDDEGTPTGEDRQATAVHAPFAGDTSDIQVDLAFSDDLPSGVGRVFGSDDDLDQITDTLRAPRLRKPAVPSTAPVLHHAAETIAEEMTTQTKQYRKELTMESDPPWVSSVDLVSEGFDISVEATGAPLASPSDIEGGPTIQMPMRQMPGGSDPDDNAQEAPSDHADDEDDDPTKTRKS